VARVQCPLTSVVVIDKSYPSSYNSWALAYVAFTWRILLSGSIEGVSTFKGGGRWNVIWRYYFTL